MRNRLVFFLLLLALYGSANVTVVYASSNVDSAKLAIDRARKSLVDAYVSVLEAEKEGADVLSLTERLTEAGSDLTKASIFFEVGSHDTALALADSAYEVGQKVEAEAADLKAVAHVNAKILFSFQMLGYVGTLVLIVLASVFGWRAFKKRHYRRILAMKPEAANNEP